MSERNLICRTLSQCLLRINKLLDSVGKNTLGLDKVTNEGFSDKVTCEQRSEETEGVKLVVFLAEEIAHAKVLRQDSGQGRARRPVWLEQGKRVGRLTEENRFCRA